MHAEDASPLFSPLSESRWKSPVSYWDRKFYELPFLLVEHGVILALILGLILGARVEESGQPPAEPKS